MEEKMSSLDKSTNGGEQVVLAVEEEEEEEEVVLPGFRFHPTDEELVGFYLRRKVDKKPLSIEIIKDIDIYKHDPWDLPKVSNVGDKEWYFFCLRGRKYKNSIRPNRVTGSGFWKATGIDRPIYSTSESNDCIGLKKSLVYYRGSAGKGTKTDWMMHEFRLPSEGKNNETNSPSTQEAEVWTICRIFKRNVTTKKYTNEWIKSTTKQQNPSDSSSKTCSFESDTGEDYKSFGASTIQQSNKNPAINYYEETNQFYAGQWNPIAQAHPFTTSHPNFPNPNTNELFNGNWDELGRIVELIDPVLAYEYRYT